VRYKYTRVVIVGALLLAGLALQAWSQDRPEDKLLQEAKLQIFDGKWAPALDNLNKLLRQYGESPAAAQALFYKAECLSKVSGRENEALQAYRDYLKNGDQNKSLAEKAEVSLIDIALRLSAKGDASALREVEDRLQSPDKDIQYYAALQLSKCRDRSKAAKSVPILQRIIRSEKDTDLTDLAKIALMRVDPKALENLDRRSEDRHARVLRIQIIEHGTSRLDISIPMALADLALAAISDKDRDMMRARGYDLDKIFSDLDKYRGSIIEIKDPDSNTAIKIWIDFK
jgi:hypothetical protein